jgi:hypothetical protein
MPNLLVLYDDKDTTRGSYFRTSVESLNLPDSDKTKYLTTDKCLEQEIGEHINDLDGHPFILLAFTHGSKDALFISGERFIDTNHAYFFGNTLFYANSCLTAKELGPCLIENNCTVFVGFNATITLCTPETDPIYQSCENSFILHFLSTNATIQESLSFMYQRYTDMQIHLVQEVNAIHASILEDNLAAFQILCSDEAKLFTKDNFKPRTEE